MYDGVLSHFEDVTCVYDVDTFVGGMRAGHVGKHLQKSFSILLVVDKGVVRVQSKPRMMACVPWSEPTVLYDSNTPDAPTPPPTSVPQPHPRKPWPNIAKVKSTLTDFYTRRHLHPVCIGPNAKREMLNFLENIGNASDPPQWVDFSASNFVESDSESTASDVAVIPAAIDNTRDNSDW